MGSNQKSYIFRHYLEAVTTKTLYKIQLNLWLMNKPQKESLIDRLLVEQMALVFSNDRSASLHTFFLKASEYYCTLCPCVYQEFISGGIESFEIYFQTPIKCYSKFI
jgi:hypothetical protein